MGTVTPSPEAGTGAEGYLWVFATEVQKTVANVLLNSTTAILTRGNQVSNDDATFMVQENQSGVQSLPTLRLWIS